MDIALQKNMLQSFKKNLFFFIWSFTAFMQGVNHQFSLTVSWRELTFPWGLFSSMSLKLYKENLGLNSTYIINKIIEFVSIY